MRVQAQLWTVAIFACCESELKVVIKEFSFADYVETLHRLSHAVDPSIEGKTAGNASASSTSLSQTSLACEYGAE